MTWIARVKIQVLKAQLISNTAETLRMISAAHLYCKSPDHIANTKNPAVCIGMKLSSLLPRLPRRTALRISFPLSFRVPPNAGCEDNLGCLTCESGLCSLTKTDHPSLCTAWSRHPRAEGNAAEGRTLDRNAGARFVAPEP